MPYYDYNKDYPFAAFITNLGKYNAVSYTHLPYGWGSSTIVNILKKREYLGHIGNMYAIMLAFIVRRYVY